MGNSNPTGSPAWGKLSIGEVPENIRDVAAVQMEQIQIWPSNIVVRTAQQLKYDASQGVAMFKPF